MPRLSFSGFDRNAEANARAMFESLHLPDWVLSDEAHADAVLIDLDSMYGQMAWMKGFHGGQIPIGLTAALRADTAYRLDAPLDPEGLRTVLAEVADALRATAGTGAATAAAAAAGAAPAVPAPPPVSSTGDAPAIHPPPPTSRLSEHIARASVPFAIQFAGLPRVVIDPQRQQFAPGKSLKALLGYASAALPADSIEVLDATAGEAALAAAGEPQPLPRLIWLLALGSGAATVRNHPPGTRFQLGRWPPVEREFPRHFRLATAMLKAPATLAEIAIAAGASEDEVADYVNAALAVGHARAT